MKILGFEIRKAADPGVVARAQIRDSNPSQVQVALNNWILRKIDPKFFEVLREAIPICETAINKRISINGRIEIIGDKEDCVKELEDFGRSVPVGHVQNGIDAYRAAMWSEGEEQGHALGEFCATEDLKDIEGLRVADSKYIIYWRNADGVPEPWYLYPETDRSRSRPLTDPAELIGQIVNARYGTTLNYNQQDMVKLNPANKFYLAPRIENGNPYGIALFRSAPWVAQLLATLQNSMKNVADRHSDPMYHAHAKGKGGPDIIKKILDDLTTQLTNAITTKRTGGSADIITAGGESGDVVIQSIGLDGQPFNYEVPVRHAEEALVAASGLSAWTLGKYWSTTERMAQLEVEIMLADGSMRNTTETPGLIRLFSAVLAMRGKKWKTITLDPKKPGDWGFRFIQPNLHNRSAEAQANFLDAEAEMLRRGGQASATVRNEGTEVPVGGQAASGTITIKTGDADITVPLRAADAGTRGRDAGRKKQVCSCGNVHSELKTQNSKLAVKELSRPYPWPDLDQIEAEYEAALKWDWNELKQKVFKIAGLKLPATEQAVMDEGRGTKDSKAAFSFDDTQRKAVMDALKEFVGIYEPTDPDSPVKWGYMQSYSLGLIRAAELVGKSCPLLDVLRNSEIFDALVQTGFRYVKDEATLAIRDRVIPAMEAGMTNGDNPLDVARTLEQEFWNQNSSWERLARTEMNGSAQQAKFDEWSARDVDMTGFVNGPRKLHPRCRCDNTVEQRDGKWYAVFRPAPDACPGCKAAAEGTKAA